MRHDLHQAAASLARTSGFSAEERRLVIDLVRGTTTRGKDIRELPTALLTRLAGKNFGWPEFDRWQAFFTRLGSFPPLWDELKTTPTILTSPDARDAYQEQKFCLLLNWLHSLEVTQAAVAHYARRGLRAGITRQGAGALCPVCDPFNDREVKEQQGHLPPFHPGCRCVIVAITDARRVAAGEARRLSQERRVQWQNSSRSAHRKIPLRARRGGKSLPSQLQHEDMGKARGSQRSRSETRSSTLQTT
jgi:hypothetical protein